MNYTFEEKITYQSISFRYARGPSLRSGNEIHPYHEIIYYVDGGATFLSEQCSQGLERGTLLFIPKETYHNFRIEDQTSYERLVISFFDTAADSAADIFMSDIKMISKPNIYILYLLNRMCDGLRQQNQLTELMLYGAFLMLIAETGRGRHMDNFAELREKDSVVIKCVHYIDAHISDPIKVSDIAGHLNLAPSTLFAVFKKELGISLHRYITQKRMILARRLIAEGKNPTKVYLDCGYGDYSSFYKAYIKMFGHPPSADKIS